MPLIAVNLIVKIAVKISTAKKERNLSTWMMVAMTPISIKTNLASSGLSITGDKVNFH